MKTLTSVLICLGLMIPGVAVAQDSATVRVPKCLEYPDIKGYTPCTGVVPVDTTTGNAISWADLFASAKGTGGSGGGGTSYTVTSGSSSAQATPVQNADGTKLATESTASSLFKAGQSIGNTTFASTQSGTWSVGISGLLPAFSSTPTFNLGTLNGAATAAKQDSIVTALGSPYQAGGALPLPAGASTSAKQDSLLTALGSPFQANGTIGNTTFGATQSGAWTVGLSGTLPGYAVTPTFNLGTAPLLTNNITQIGGSAITLGQKTQANSIPVSLSSDGTYATSANQQAMIAQFPASLGAKTAANSLSVVTASDAPGTSSGNPLFTTSTAPSSVNSQASTTSGQMGILVQGAVTTTAPTYTTGTTNPLSLTAAGALRTDGSGSTQPVSGTVTAALQAGGVSLTSNTSSTSVVGSIAALNVSALSRLYNGGAWAQGLDVVGAGNPNGQGVIPAAMFPSNSSNVGIAPQTVANPTSQVVKATAGNLFALNIDNAAVAGTYVIDYNASAAPASGATLTASLMIYHAMLPSGGTFEKVFSIPAYAANGHVLLYSTSLTTFTPPATNPLLSTAMFK